MTTIEAIQTFIQACPCLEVWAACAGVDRLGREKGCYSIETVPCQPVLKQYADGSTVRQYLFNLVSQEDYGPEIRQNLDNLGVYERFSSWLEEQTTHGKLPVLGAGKQALKVEALTVGYAYATGLDAAQYRMECKLTYFQEGQLWQE